MTLTESNVFLIIVAVLMISFFSIWSQKGWCNVALKTLFLLLALWDLRLLKFWH